MHSFFEDRSNKFSIENSCREVLSSCLLACLLPTERVLYSLLRRKFWAFEGMLNKMTLVQGDLFAWCIELFFISCIVWEWLLLERSLSYGQFESRSAQRSSDLSHCELSICIYLRPPWLLLPSPRLALPPPNAAGILWLLPAVRYGAV